MHCVPSKQFHLDNVTAQAGSRWHLKKWPGRLPGSLHTSSSSLTRLVWMEIKLCSWWKLQMMPSEHSCTVDTHPFPLFWSNLDFLWSEDLHFRNRAAFLPDGHLPQPIPSSSSSFPAVCLLTKHTSCFLTPRAVGLVSILLITRHCPFWAQEKPYQWVQRSWLKIGVSWPSRMAFTWTSWALSRTLCIC